MRHWRFATLVTAIAVLVSASPALANGSGAATFTEHQFNVTDTFLDANFCTGDPAMITTIRTGVFHVTELPNFTYHITGTATGTFELVPLDPALPTYIGRFTQHFSESGNGQNFTASLTISVRGTGSDGSRLHFIETAHFSVSATGVVVEFDTPRCA